MVAISFVHTVSFLILGEEKEAQTIYQEIWDDYQTGYAHYEDLRMAFESYSEAIKLLKSFDD